MNAAADFARAMGSDPVSLTLLYAGAPASAPAVNPPQDSRLDWKPVGREGAAVEVILEEAEASQADLIVMATEARKGILGLLRGSVTEKVMRASGRPVLAVPAQH